MVMHHVRCAKRLLWVAAGIVMVSSSLAAAQPSIRLRIPKTQYLQCEPIMVTVTVTNPGATDLQVLDMLSPSTGTLAVRVTRPGEEEGWYRPWVTADILSRSLSDRVISLGPGDSYATALSLTYEMRNGSVIPLLFSPGEYTLSAEYSVPPDWPTGPASARSNSVTFSVSRPAEADQRAYEALLAALGPSGSLWPWGAESEFAETYEAVLTQYPNSGYAQHVAFYLAQVYELMAETKPRGTPEANVALARSADLYASVSDEAAQTPLGVFASRLAARAYAKLGDITAASEFFQQSFLSPAATEHDRTETLSWMDLTNRGVFRRAPTGSREEAQIAIPVRQAARALGFRVDWDSTTKTVALDSPRVRSTFSPGQAWMTVNGAKRLGVCVKLQDGRVLVWPGVLATLMAEHYGQGVENAFPSQMIAQAVP